MRLVVCLKQAEEAVFVRWSPPFASFTRRYADPTGLAALEHALRLAAGAAQVVALTVGPPDAERVLAKAAMMGVERAVRVWGERLAGADSLAVAMVLAAAARRLDGDLLLLGARSSDTGTEAVGAAVAELLDLPLVTRVVGIERDADGARLLVHRKLPRGERETHRVPCPAVVTIDPGGDEPRYCAPGWMRRTRRLAVETLRPEELGVADGEPRLVVLEVAPPRPRAKVGVQVAGLSLKDKLAVMRGGRKQDSAEERIIEAPAPQAARRLKAALERLLAARS
ncbi:MAG: hypothetical protein HYY35_04275 [Deltaproteobacteria bacterium]|nr:hypothetical protein [Deltaproteobacteria bacterium]